MIEIGFPCEVSVHADPSIADEELDRSAELLDRLIQLRRPIGARETDRNNLNLRRALQRERLGRSRQRLLVAGGDDELVMIAREAFGQFQADTARGASDQGI
jgi:hypothetical protein